MATAHSDRPRLSLNLDPTMRVAALLVRHLGLVAEIYKLRDMFHASQRHPSSLVSNI